MVGGSITTGWDTPVGLGLLHKRFVNLLHIHSRHIKKTILSVIIFFQAQYSRKRANHVTASNSDKPVVTKMDLKETSLAKIL